MKSGIYKRDQRFCSWLVVFAFALFGSLTVQNACAAPVKKKLVVKIQSVNKGGGKVVSKVRGIKCGKVCTHKFPAKSRVVLTATAKKGSVFAGWSPSKLCPGKRACSVKMKKSRVIKAIFVGPYTLTVEKTLAESSTGSVISKPAGIDCGGKCSAKFSYNTDVVLSALAGSDSLFSGWTPDSLCPGGGKCTVRMDSAKKITANFTRVLTSRGNAYSWHTFFGPEGITDRNSAPAIAVDKAGNTFIAGTTNAGWLGPDKQHPLHNIGSSDSSIFLIKLDSNGGYLWHTFYSSDLDSGELTVTDMAVDFTGSVVVTGLCAASRSWDKTPWNTDHEVLRNTHYTPDAAWYVAKFTPSGNLSWYTIYGGSIEDSPGKIAVDPNGNVIYTACSNSSLNDIGREDGVIDGAPVFPFTADSKHFPKNGMVMKLNSAGAHVWHTFTRSATVDGAWFCEGDLAVDSDGNTYLVSLATKAWLGANSSQTEPLHAFSGKRNLAVMKLDVNGAYSWHTFFGGEKQLGSTPTSVTVSGNGEVYAGGYSYGGNWYGPDNEEPLHSFTGGESYSINTYVLKLDGAGEYQWHTFIGEDTKTIGIASDVFGNLSLVGGSGKNWNGPGGEAPLNGSGGTYIMSLGSGGAYRWHTFFDQNLSTNFSLDSEASLFFPGSSNSTWNGPGGEAPVDAYVGVKGPPHSNGYALKMGGIR